MEFIRSLIIFLCVLGCLGQDIVTTPSPDDVPTTEPTTTTTTTTSETTTTETTTTTPDTTTTTTAATTTPVPTTTTTESPSDGRDEFYRVTKDNVTCVMFSGDVEFTITYPTHGGKTAQIDVHVPSAKDSTINATSSGSCGDADSDLQHITVRWGPTNTRSSFTLVFNSSASNWEMLSTEASVYIDESAFVNATDAGKFLQLKGRYPGLSYVPVYTNASLACHSAIDSKNFTAMLSDSNSTNYSVTSTAIGFKVQAFNFIPNQTKLQESIRCEADMTSDLVPIAVGCALAGLVILVLISYLIGRRRRSAAYQSV